jgi:hypothetical protein
MRKLPLLLLIIIALVLFASADFYLNRLSLPSDPLSFAQKSPVTIADPDPVVLPTVFKLNQVIEGYRVTDQVQTSQLFDNIDLTTVGSVKIYKHKLEKEGSTEEVAPNKEQITVYEIHGPKGQGSLTYLNIKLQFIGQINARTQTLNEDAQFGHNSFFYNDLNYKNTGFIVTQINDNLYGFQYNKSDPQFYTGVQALIQKLLSGTLSLIPTNLNYRG